MEQRAGTGVGRDVVTRQQTRVDREPSIVFIALGELDKTSCLRATQLCLHMRRMGWRAEVAVPDTPVNRESRQCESLNPLFFSTRLSRFRVDVGRLLGEHQPDFVHFLNPKEKAIAISIGNSSFRYVYDWEDWSTFWESNRIRRWYKERRERWLVRRGAVLLTASRWLSEYLKTQYQRDSLYLPYACLPREFPRSESVFSEPTAVAMGNLYASWDHDLLVDAAGLLRRMGCEPSIRLIGTGPDFDATQRRVQSHELKRFSMPGYLSWDAMLAELQSAHCIVFPIRPKPLNLARCPFKCFQFAQSQRPVITSDVGEVRAILGDRAVYVEPTPQGIASALQTMMAAPRLAEVPFDLSGHQWSIRASELSEHLRAAAVAIRS